MDNNTKFLSPRDLVFIYNDSMLEFYVDYLIGDIISTHPMMSTYFGTEGVYLWLLFEHVFSSYNSPS